MTTAGAWTKEVMAKRNADIGIGMGEVSIMQSTNQSVSFWVLFLSVVLATQDNKSRVY